MANILKPKRSNVAGATPTTAQLADGEMAVNTADRKFFVRVGAAIVEFASSAAAIAISQVTGLQDALNSKFGAADTFVRGKNGPNAPSFHDGSDLNDWSGSFFAYANSSILNRPPMGNASILGFGLLDYGVQLGARSDQLAFRTQNAGVWREWQQVMRAVDFTGLKFPSDGTYGRIYGDNGDNGIALARSGTQVLATATNLVRLDITAAGGARFDLQGGNATLTATTFTTNGNIEVSGWLYASGGRIYGNNTSGGDTHIVNGNPDGHITIRPKGWATAGQTVFRNDGSVDFAGRINVNGALLASTPANSLEVTSNYGNVSIGPNNAGFCHIQTDMNRFYFNKTISVNGDIEFYNGPKVPRTYVQVGDPGAAAGAGAVWISPA